MFNLNNFYKSKEWEDLLEQLKLERVNSSGEIICEHCGKPIYKKYDMIGHHKEELTEANVNDYNISLNKTNIMLIHFMEIMVRNAIGYNYISELMFKWLSDCIHENYTQFRQIEFIGTDYNY